MFVTWVHKRGPGPTILSITILLALIPFVRAAPAAPLRSVLWQQGVKNAYPRWSKDGKRVLFQSNRSGTWPIFLMDHDSRNQRQRTEGKSNNNFPDWSPDNRSIAFVSDRDGNEGIFVLDAPGRLWVELAARR